MAPQKDPEKWMERLSPSDAMKVTNLDRVSPLERVMAPLCS